MHDDMYKYKNGPPAIIGTRSTGVDEPVLGFREIGNLLHGGDVGVAVNVREAGDVVGRREIGRVAADVPVVGILWSTSASRCASPTLELTHGRHGCSPLPR